METKNKDVCEICGGTGEVSVMGQVYAGEPHTAPVDTAPCECQISEDDGYDELL